MYILYVYLSLPFLADTTNPKKDAKLVLGGDTLDTLTASTTSGSASTGYEILRVWPALPGGNWNSWFGFDTSKNCTDL